MLGILLSRVFRKYAKNFNFNVARPPINCYATKWWRELLVGRSRVVCDCTVWCKYPITNKPSHL